VIRVIWRGRGLLLEEAVLVVLGWLLEGGLGWGIGGGLIEQRQQFDDGSDPDLVTRYTFCLTCLMSAAAHFALLSRSVSVFFWPPRLLNPQLINLQMHAAK